MKSMKKYVADTVSSIPPSGIRRFFDLVSQSQGVISLGVGEPDFVTPWHIREACCYSLEKGYTMYTSNQGLLELREEIAAYMYRTIGVRYDPEEEILVTVGVSEAVDLALRALINPGDEVLIPEPSYVCYGPITSLVHGKPVMLKTTAENEFRLTREQLVAGLSPRSKVLVLPYPNNPTGGIMGWQDLADLVDVIVDNDLIVVSDEIYGELTYNGRHVSIASLPGMRERTIVLNGFSKAFAMTGWRIGYACGDGDLIAAMNRIHQYSMLCAPIMSQMAAIEALRHGEHQMREMIQEYDYRRRVIVKGMRDIGLDCFEPRGAFYIFPSIRGTGMKSEEFAERLLMEEKVAVVPGNAFGESGEGFVRCCYAASLNNIEEAIERMGRFVERNRIRAAESGRR
ncbi:MAG TPA: aminotransferase class I/II-fold pyridoxal phosphate-dependent enzyme [Syntrophothermus lipocalidus]|uniref:Aminotransferase n=1 Tax=Syntrophothermus lipocalidus (strain DSM 12680 / TGB-C1) TaxID=643648 RepID=D7CN68_SYNLT|nr:aminotransferase class I/II-fold pyridoxal phosphate-dependent enzyme [Syntrophothermus lipocalidus]ADI02153.1 aminotransferase class I and II [Syntrophothermus lipocalidus DSM 12680]HHV76005.1 aminotransferase class I/II-fold pyridoxal phosphate-dependent enzyme [Syntrophothermus lipocalidus]HOV43522.1 aminotransferase class I/II-fold pyridoxal phosphate-dependent enzyme [Syntrophothermus lipocalidus]